MAFERLRVDRGQAIETELNESDAEHWIAGPLPLEYVDVSREGHFILIDGGDRSEWESTAGHAISRTNSQLVYLYGREAFHEP